jgi:hypothetical protein
MERHQPRDLDGVIDDVARAMTSRELARDLRPAVAARIASAPSWTFAWLAGWRAGLSAAGVAAVVLVAVVMRPTPEPPHTAADVRATAPAAGSVTAVGEKTLPAATGDQAAAIPRSARAVARQAIDDAAASAWIVEVSPLAIVPLEENEAAAALASPQLVEIAPIDVEPVRVSQLELVE